MNWRYDHHNCNCNLSNCGSFSVFFKSQSYIKYSYSVLSFITDVQDPRAVVVLTPVKLLVFDLLSSSAKYVVYLLRVGISCNPIGTAL